MKLQVKTDEERIRLMEIIHKHGAGCIGMSEDSIDFSGKVSFDLMKDIVDYLSAPKDNNKDLFEECWVAYRRKGVKKRAYSQWVKLDDAEKQRVMPHIKAYVSSRDVVYQKDFERYLRDRVFDMVVYQGNNIIYNPTASDKEGQYNPICGYSLFYDENECCFIYTGYWNGNLADGYTDDNRPDGATVKLNNARGTMVWSATTKMWNVK